MIPSSWRSELNLGTGKRILANRGDLILMHQRVAHNNGINLSDQESYNLFFRVVHKDFDRLLTTQVASHTPFVGFTGLEVLEADGEKGYEVRREEPVERR